MKVSWTVIALLLAQPSPIAQTRYTKQQAVTYGKALDVAKLDPTLSPQRLDEWLRSKTIHLDTVTWEISDTCDRKPVGTNDVEPLCLKVRLVRGKVGGWALIAVGNSRDGITGAPHLEYVAVWSRNGMANGRVHRSDQLSDLPRLLKEATQTD